ncbi:MAG: hypothetical protein ABRQ26_04635 [Syntrophomonadaceae bacterium]
MRRIVFFAIEKFEESAREHFLALCSNYTPLVEPCGDEGAYLDLGGCGDARAIILAIGAGFYHTAGACLQAGLASSRLLSRMAAARSPDALAALPGSFKLFSGPGITLIEVLPGRESKFMAPFPLNTFPLLSPGALKKLLGLGFSCIGDLGAISPVYLGQLSGHNPDRLAQSLAGIDPTPVRGLYPPGRISYKLISGEDGRLNFSRLDEILRIASGELEGLLESRHCGCRHIKLEIESKQGAIIRERKLGSPCSRSGQLKSILSRLWPEVLPDSDLSQVFIYLQDLTPVPLCQPDLFLNRTFFAEREREHLLNDLLENLQGRFPGALRQGLELNRREQVLALWDPWRNGGVQL